MIPLLVGGFGAIIGSFLNVVVFRVPAGRSIVSPPSACGSCGHVVRPYDNIPVLSWLVLRGKCRDCRAPISARYPLVEIAGALAFGVVAWWFLPGILAAPGPAEVVAAVLQLAAFLYLAAVSIALVLIDLDTHRLPNALVVPAYLVGAVLLGVAGALTGSWSSLVLAAVGMAALGGVYLVLALVRPGGMGMGDVKLAGVLGLFLGALGLPELLVGAVAGSVLGGLAGVVLLVAGRARSSAVAFGPWLIAGAWVGILAGDPIASGYLALFGLG